MKKNQSQNKLAYVIIICITIILSVGIFGVSNYKKEQFKQEEQNKRLDEEKKAENERKLMLEACMIDANNSRTNLWNTNCITQSDGSCKIRTDSGLIEWIEQRYQQDVDKCNSLYGK